MEKWSNLAIFPWSYLLMKICFVCDSYKPLYDGVVRYLDYVIPALIEAGHTVSLACPRYQGCPKYEYPYEGFTVVRCTSTRIVDQDYEIAIPDFRLLKALKEADFVVIHSIMFLGGLGAFLARAMRKKMGIFIHQDERLILRDVLETPEVLRNIGIIALSKILYPLCMDVFFHATERFKGKLIDFGVPTEKIFHTPFAINQEQFNPNPPIFDIRKRYNIPKDAVVSVYVGRLAKEKNVRNMLDGFDRAAEEQPNLYGLFVGGGPDWDYYTSLEWKHKDRMIFTGFVPDEELQSHYVAADFFLSPSINESQCFTVFEAMSCKLPVITSEHRHDPDVIHLDNAVLVENLMNPNEIKDYILLLAKDEKLRKKIGQNGYDLIKDRTWVNHVKVFEKGINFALNYDISNKRFKAIRNVKYRYPPKKESNKKK
jgi:1,2-diacylglycerol 3-alpha-glucosyltransferase